MEDLGYETHNSMLNLGSLAIFSFVYYLKLLFYYLCMKPVAKRGYCKKNIAAFGSKLIFNEIISLSVSSYIVFIISAYLGTSAPLNTTDGE